MRRVGRVLRWVVVGLATFAVLDGLFRILTGFDWVGGFLVVGGWWLIGYWAWPDKRGRA